MTLYLLTYNNYYNRIVKKFDYIDEYKDFVREVYSNVNFNPNDGIQTEHIVNYDGQMPDYCIVTDSYDNIISRWFITNATRTRAQQYRLLLYRDLISDWYDDVVNAPMFIEKATLPLDSPLLYNNEDMTFNQIKTKEFLLKDKTGCPWIVGYYAKNTPTENLSGTIDTNDTENVYDLKINVPFENWEYNATINPFGVTPKEITYRIYAMHMTTASGFQTQQGYLKFDRNGNYTGWKYVKDLDASLDCNFNEGKVATELQPAFSSLSGNLYNYLKSYTNIRSEVDTNYFLNLNGKIIKDTTGRFFQLSVRNTSSDSEVVEITAGVLYQQLKGICSTSTTLTGTPDNESFKVEVVRDMYTMTATELFGLSTTWDMTGDKVITEDASYNIFAIPYGEVEFVYDNKSITTSNPVISLAAANSIINTMTPNASGGYLYDIQLLPYCPISTNYEGMIAFDSGENSRVSFINNKDNEPVGFILNIANARFTKNIAFSIEAPANAVDAKISNECDKYRLCSPNFNGSFDFSVAKNKGVTYFNIDCTYKPFQPYIHINPDFKGLYGNDFNDPRGLICGGDFSLSQISDAWQSYQIQNKNFNETFNRQIENMEVNNSVQRTMERWNVATGTISGSTTGAMTGAMVGGPWGAAIGGVVGGATSLAGGLADITLNEKLRAEAIDYTKDQFGYNLGNIQALPYSLAKVDSFNYNNKVFPILEYYTCTEEEKEAFRNKLKYNGMTVMAIGHMKDYIMDEPTYIKGKLIRLESDKYTDSFNVYNSIANELNKGVFV